MMLAGQSPASSKVGIAVASEHNYWKYFIKKFLSPNKLNVDIILKYHSLLNK